MEYRSSGRIIVNMFKTHTHQLISVSFSIFFEIVFDSFTEILKLLFTPSSSTLVTIEVNVLGTPSTPWSFKLIDLNSNIG